MGMKCTFFTTNFRISILSFRESKIAFCPFHYTCEQWNGNSKGNALHCNLCRTKHLKQTILKALKQLLGMGCEGRQIGKKKAMPTLSTKCKKMDGQVQRPNVSRALYAQLPTTAEQKERSRQKMDTGMGRFQISTKTKKQSTRLQIKERQQQNNQAHLMCHLVLRSSRLSRQFNLRTMSFRYPY